MSPTNEQIIAEAKRRSIDSVMTLESHIIEVMREGWTPPESVDPDVLAWREWAARRSEANGSTDWASNYRQGRLDQTDKAQAYLAGARMAREQERERAKVLVDNLANLVWRVGADWAQDDVTGINASEMISAREALAKYRGEA